MQNDTLTNFSLLRKRANLIRRQYIEEMERHLLAYEQILIKNNIKVFWINDEKELVETFFSLLPKTNFNKVCFDLDKIPEDIQNHNLQIKRVFLEDLLNKSENCDFLLTKADFGVVETGDIILINKESKNNFNQVSNLVILLDINKLIVREQDVEFILYLQSIYKYKTFLPDDIKIFNAPFDRIRANEFYVTDAKNYTTKKVNISLFLYDNGITTILENQFLREALYCIECERCKKVCPVYQITNQYAPIDLIKINTNNRFETTKTILKNTTFCGNCNEVCPVNIPFTELMIKQLEQAKVKNNRSITLYKSFSKRNKMNKLSGWLRRKLFLWNYYRKNKTLFDYYSLQHDPFFNIQWQEQKKED